MKSLLNSLIRNVSTSTMNINLKTAKGMRDIHPGQAWQRKRIFRLIEDCFERNGALPLDTPVCELREILAGKYGEESKLIYNLEDQGGELLSLRYDLTVPFARYLGQNKIQAMTRYQIAKVYRRDNPSMNQGRFREFYQCDLDFAGKYDTMMADAQCLKVLCKILETINLPCPFLVKINHRAILNGMFRVCGVPDDKFKPICSAIDKLDKMSWEDVKKEMCTEKGLSEEAADKIRTYVERSGDANLIQELLDGELGKDDSSRQGLEELLILCKYTSAMRTSKHIKFDMSLARGLDYYTGLIFEASVEGDVGVGSIAAGGRYDNLVSSLLQNPNFSVPCVGVSIGVERIFAILQEQESTPQMQFHCCIGSTGDGMTELRLELLEKLDEQGIKVKNILKDRVKPLVLYQTCEKENIPFAIFFGTKDIEQNVVSVRNISSRADEKVPLNQLAERLIEKLGIK